MPARGKTKRGRITYRKSGISDRAFAKLMDVSPPVVRKARRSGRLRKSLGNDGRIEDVALAKQEWLAGATKPANSGSRTPEPSTSSEVDTLVQAQVRLASERATALELANARKRGQLLDAATVEREQFEAARMLRDRILNVPDRLADLGPVVRTRLRAELRQALGYVADIIEHD